MSSKYHPLLHDLPRDDDDTQPPQEIVRFTWLRTLKIPLVMIAAVSFYTFGVCWVMIAVIQAPHLNFPLSSFPHPSEKEYVIQETGHGGATPLHTLAFGEPSPEIDEGWYALLQPFNTRVPEERFKAMNRSSIQVGDGSGDYYVTLTMYHEIHCLMRIRWFLYPNYYENKTWEEQFEDPHIVGHFKHCIWSLLESVMCHGDTSIRTFHWEPNKPAPVADSPAERKCVKWDWLYEWTMERSFVLEDRVLSHPVFGQLDENLMPVKLPEGYTLKHAEERSQK